MCIYIYNSFAQQVNQFPAISFRSLRIYVQLLSILFLKMQSLHAAHFFPWPTEIIDLNFYYDDNIGGAFLV